MSTEVFEVVRPGVLTTVQDLGRGGYLADGIPPSGAFDGAALKLANLLVANPVGDHVLVGTDPGAAGLEITVQGPRLRVLADAVIAFAGADVRPTVNGARIDMWTAVAVHAGDEVACGAAHDGVRAYLAVAGGIDVPQVLGSRATNVRAGIGGVEGRAVVAGDRIAALPQSVDPMAAAGRRLRQDRIPVRGTPTELRVVLGPQDHLFEPESVRTFLGVDWQLSPTSDRMGCRFIGPALSFLPRPDHLVAEAGSDPSNIVDDSICIGSIQVPSGVEPIAMGVDGPSLGGYAKIATVISPDLSRLAQLRPGESARFRAVTPQQAHDAHVAARAIGDPSDLEVGA